MFRNERVLYRRENNAQEKEGETMISIHRPNTDLIIYDDRTWWSDKWDPIDFGMDYDFTESFFGQYHNLYKKIPLINLSITNMVDCNFCNVSEGDKGSYMITASNQNEDCFYGNRMTQNKQSMEIYIGSYNNLCYEIVNSSKNYKVLYSTNSYESVDSYFLYNCKNCTDCIGCVNLRNKSYCVFNIQYSKEEYQKIKSELFLDSHEGINSVSEKHNDLILKNIHKFGNLLKTFSSTGDNLENTNNVLNSFDINEAQDSKNLNWGGYGLRDSMDAGPGVGIQSELLYDCFDTALQTSSCFWTSVVYHSFDVRYSINCHSCSNIFGCYGLRSKQYCILNKQYTKEEYEKLIPKIIEHMNNVPYIDIKNRVFKYGEFFPYEISPFDYNETIAQEYFPISKDEAINRGWSWCDKTDKNYVISLSEKDIPASISITNDSIVENIVECANKGLNISNCTKAFKILKDELDFYKRLNIPIPHYCPNCRHYNRLLKRNSMKLFKRYCMCDVESHGHEGKCEVEFETSYATDRPEIVYCEKCYQQEVI